MQGKIDLLGQLSHLWIKVLGKSLIEKYVFSRI